MPTIHATALLEGDVELAGDVHVGPHCVLTGPVRVGRGCRLVGSAYVHGPLTMGEGNTVYPFCCLGFAAQHVKCDPGRPGPGVVIGSGNTFREHVSVHRALLNEHPTIIGDRNYFMSASHAGHDSRVGNDCTLVSGAMLGGHVVVEDRAMLGGTTGVHQFCRVGRGAMLAGGTILTVDLPPWFMLTGTNVCGSVNLVGMRRNGFSRAQIDTVRWVHRTLCREKRSLTSAIEVLRKRASDPLVAEYLLFIERASRSLCTSRSRSIRGSTAEIEVETRRGVTESRDLM